MTNQEMYYNILKKKYNILKKNLIIIEQTEEKINEFKNTIKEIDGIEQERFKKDLEIKKELTTNLEDEYKRLYDYITLIEERHRKRMVMIEDYNNIVKENINELEQIEDYENIDFYSRRLDDICNYLNNDEKYSKLIEEKENYVNLKEEYDEKYNSLRKTIDDFELNLLIKLKNSISNNVVYNKLDFEKLDDSIKDFEDKLEEKEKELTTYLNSYKALIDANITEEEKEDYLKFITEEKEDYLDILEKKYILLIYKYVNSNNNEAALKVYEERLDKLNKYNLNDNSNLKEVFDIINNFMIKKEMLDEIELTIESIKNNIEECENKIIDVKNELNKENIKNLLKEFCIEKEYIDNNKDESENEDELLFNDDFIKEEELNTHNEEDGEELIEIIEENNINNIDDYENLINDIELDKKEDEVESIILGLGEDNKNEETENNIAFEEKNKQEKEEDFLELDTTIENEVKLEPVIMFDDSKNKETLNVNIKDDAIKEIKELNERILIDEIRQKALQIMKSVCNSVI